MGVAKELFFRAVGGTNPPVPAKIKKNDNKILKLFCSARFVAYKNHKTLIKVIHGLVQENYVVKLYLAGDCPLREEIQHQVKSLGLNDSVIFLGEIPPAEVTNLFPKIDLYIQLSIEERREVEGGFYFILKEWADLYLPLLVQELGSSRENLVHSLKLYLVLEELL